MSTRLSLFYVCQNGAKLCKSYILHIANNNGNSFVSMKTKEKDLDEIHKSAGVLRKWCIK